MKTFSARVALEIAVAFAVTCTWSLSATAADKKNCTPGQTVTQDVEGAGHLTASAHFASAAKRFDLMDTDRDGKVTAKEIGASRGAESIAWASKMTSARDKVAELDTNRDGVLTRDEYAHSSQGIFNKLDADRNGVLSDAEMLQPYQGRGR